MSHECVRPMTNRSGTLLTANTSISYEIREETCYSKTILECIIPSKPKEKAHFSIISECMDNAKSLKAI